MSSLSHQTEITIETGFLCTKPGWLYTGPASASPVLGIKVWAIMPGSPDSFTLALLNLWLLNHQPPFDLITLLQESGKPTRFLPNKSQGGESPVSASLSPAYLSSLFLLLPPSLFSMIAEFPLHSLHDETSSTGNLDQLY